MGYKDMEFVETSGFLSIREDYLDDQQFNLLQLYLAGFPDAGNIIKGSGGIRKLRWGEKGRGKQGGLRVIYFWIPKSNQILFLTVYRKSEMSDISKEAVLRMKEIVKSLF